MSKSSNKLPGCLLIFQFFFTWWLIGCERLKEPGVYLISQTLRNRIIFWIQIYEAHKFFSLAEGRSFDMGA